MAAFTGCHVSFKAVVNLYKTILLRTRTYKKEAH
jgi:hypothetical protein